MGVEFSSGTDISVLLGLSFPTTKAGCHSATPAAKDRKDYASHNSFRKPPLPGYEQKLPLKR